MSLATRAGWTIERNLNQPLSLDWLAEACGVSRFHLAHAFGDATGRSVMRYVRSRRLSEAAKRLAKAPCDVTLIDRELKDWNDFIDAAKNEASGKTSLLDDPSELTGLYFWANGIPWTTTDPDDLAAAEAFLVDLAPHISAFDSYPGGSAIPQATQMLMQAYNGDARLGILESPDPERWKFVLGSPATELWMDNWAIAAGAPNPEAAHAFIDYVLAPENALAELDYIGYDTGAKDIQQVAADAGLPMLDLVFFTPEQLATMEEGELTEAQERVVQIWNATKAAAGA